LEVDVPEGHDNGDRRMIRGGVSDPKIKTERSNQLLDEEGFVLEGDEGLHCAATAEGGFGGREEDVGRGENPSDNTVA
jgi:hypothetical protein